MFTKGIHDKSQNERKSMNVRMNFACSLAEPGRDEIYNWITFSIKFFFI